jgi:hypothetical protein
MNETESVSQTCPERHPLDHTSTHTTDSRAGGSRSPLPGHFTGSLHGWIAPDG